MGKYAQGFSRAGGVAGGRPNRQLRISSHREATPAPLEYVAAAPVRSPRVVRALRAAIAPDALGALGCSAGTCSGDSGCVSPTSRRCDPSWSCPQPLTEVDAWSGILAACRWRADGGQMAGSRHARKIVSTCCWMVTQSGQLGVVVTRWRSASLPVDGYVRWNKSRAVSVENLHTGSLTFCSDCQRIGYSAAGLQSPATAYRCFVAERRAKSD